MTANEWKDYTVIASGDGEKLENWGGVLLLRPDPQIIWKAQFPLKDYKGLNAHYIRSSTGGGQWNILKPHSESWNISYKDLTFKIMPMGFKHTGLFPEQAANWELMREKIETNLKNKAYDEIRVLNLFGYTGGATVALAKSGAKVTHVDAAKGMVERARQNCELSNVTQNNVRYIIDDCKKFVQREIKRGKKYDAILMDPPSYGRGPTGELWKIEDDLFDLVSLTTKVLSDNPLFYLINSYTTGLSQSVLSNILSITLKEYKGKANGYELTIPTKEDGIVIPCGHSSLWSKN